MLCLVDRCALQLVTATRGRGMPTTCYALLGARPTYQDCVGAGAMTLSQTSWRCNKATKSPFAKGDGCNQAQVGKQVSKAVLPGMKCCFSPVAPRRAICAVRCFATGSLVILRVSPEAVLPSQRRYSPGTATDALQYFALGPKSSNRRRQKRARYVPSLVPRKACA